MLLFHPYCADYFQACLVVFKRNIPDFFHENEVEDFIKYLDSFAEGQYWVCEKDGQVIGAGGIRVVGDVGRLVYGFIDPDFHKQGFGRALLNFRLNKLSENPSIKSINIDTTPQSRGFFRHCGFIEVNTIRNGIFGDFDMVDMSLNIR